MNWFRKIFIREISGKVVAAEQTEKSDFLNRCGRWKVTRYLIESDDGNVYGAGVFGHHSYLDRGDHVEMHLIKDTMKGPFADYFGKHVKSESVDDDWYEVRKIHWFFCDEYRIIEPLEQVSREIPYEQIRRFRILERGDES